MKRLLAAGFAAACALSGAQASAQERISLSAGFLPDPVSIDIYSGGSTDASGVAGNCAGMIADEPDIILTFQSQGGPLGIAAYSSGDTSLVINGPDGRWYCNDDADGLNPQLRWGRASSGQYDIWVGAVGDAASSTVLITEGDF